MGESGLSLIPCFYYSHPGLLAIPGGRRWLALRGRQPMRELARHLILFDISLDSAYSSLYLMPLFFRTIMTSTLPKVI